MLELSNKDFKTYNYIYFVQKVKWKHGRFTEDPNWTSRDESFSIRYEKYKQWVCGRLDIVEESFSKLEDIAVEILQNETQTEE